MTVSRADLRSVLHERSPAIVGEWYHAVRNALVALHSPSDVRSLLSGIWDEATAFLLHDDGQPRDAAPIGASFARLGIRSENIGEIELVLLTRLLEDLPHDVEQVLRARVPRLIAGLTTGFVQADREKLLEEQEEIREAYGRSLRRAEDQLRVMSAGIEGSINAVGMLDLDGRMTYVNRAFLDMWGYDADGQVLGRHVSEFGEWRGDVERTLGILSEHGGWVGELVGLRHDGSPFDVQASVSLVHDGGGRPSGLIAFFVDITERKETQEALHRRASQATFLNEIGEEIAGERTTQGVLERAVQMAHQAFDLQQVTVLLLDREREALDVAAVASSHDDVGPDGCSIPLGEGVTGWVARENRTAVVGDVSVDPRYVELLPNRATTRSELAVPIRVAGRVIGVLDAQSPTYDAFGKDDQVVIETLADQIAVALENARLYQALQDELAQRKEAESALWRSVRRLETVHEIDQAILGAKSREEVGQALLHNLQELVPCQRASIDLLDFDAGEILVLAAEQTIGEGRALAGARFPLVRPSELDDMLYPRQAVYVGDLRRLPPEPIVRAVRGDGIRSVLMAPITAQGQLIGLLSLGSDHVDGFEAQHRPIVQELADTAGIAIQQAHLFDSVRQHRERLRQTLSRLAEVEETERRRVVRELHDRVGQNLTALDLNLSLVRSQLEKHGFPQLGARLDDSLSLVEQTNRRIRRLMIDLRPPVLDDYGLLSALHWYGDRFAGRTGIAVAVEGDEELTDGLSPHVENALFRIAQEALNNIAKHARADVITIALTADEVALRLTITDDGRGFDPESAESKRGSWGLLTMRERAESVGASCCFDSTPGEGTRVVVELSP